MEQITLICNACCELFDVEIVEGLNLINRHEDFGDPLLCPVCVEESDEEETDHLLSQPV